MIASGPQRPSPSTHSRSAASSPTRVVSGVHVIHNRIAPSPSTATGMNHLNLTIVAPPDPQPLPQSPSKIPRLSTGVPAYDYIVCVSYSIRNHLTVLDLLHGETANSHRADSPARVLTLVRGWITFRQTVRYTVHEQWASPSTPHRYLPEST